ncbi:ACT11D09.5 [Cucumis melo var. makuwa]|uniref:ACT11D09.5 n=1 Tax=Cucumis melo var. makuwa TaxID=1194695 RepID=A0A5D3CTE9_CUCMM|nr:ACT11D09.5 [Cucumis melo var. makuwa]
MEDVEGVEGNIIDSFRIGRYEVALSHLQYADDTRSFCFGKESFLILNHMMAFLEDMSRKDSSEIGDVEERILLESWQVNLDYVGAGGISRGRGRSSISLGQLGSDGAPCLLGGGLCLLGLFAVCFIERRRKTLIIFFGIASRHELCRAFFLQEFGVSHAGHRGIRATIEEFLLHLSFREKGRFLWLAGCELFVRHLGRKEQLGVSW